MWALWHSIAFVQTDYSLPWILWQSLKTIAMRMVLVWLYTRSGRSIQATILYHTTDNVAWSLFPNLGTHYNPMVIALLTVATVLALIGLAGRKKSKSLN
jgi:membrane protease YdiL (CAAX protease family)